ncbi:xylan 1,4-beta-xylosidase [Lactococcus kimchii]|nr:xylan 1,4-beta-xylosidase [Lactococcus sp. S-13]
MDKNDVKQRFEKISGGLSGMAVIVDKETGIEYLFCAGSGGGGGLSVLLDREGKPKIHQNYR